MPHTINHKRHLRCLTLRPQEKGWWSQTLLPQVNLGCTYRRLATKTGLRSRTDALGAELAPIQLGFGSRDGCEAAVHATRVFLDTMPADNIIVKIDMRNAFNTIRRDHFLNIVGSRVPSLLPLLHQAYSRPTPLYFRGTEIRSNTGVQQGDPAGPAVFALAVDEVAHVVRSPLNVWYLDDATIGGPLEQVLDDLSNIIPLLEGIGLVLNSSKCEVITSRIGTPDLTGLSAIIPNCKVIRHDSANLLGSPLTSEAADTILADRELSLRVMIDRMHRIEPHQAFFLLQNCLWVPKLLYILRTSPCHLTSLASLQRMDEFLREALSSLTNICFTDTSWAQAVLPIRLGGLGLRSLSDLAHPAYASSLHGSALLMKHILPSDLHLDVDLRCSAVVSEWILTYPELDPPAPPLRSSQKAWDIPAATQKYDSLLGNSDQLTRARLLAAAAPGSGAWLQAIPSAAYGMLLDSESLRIGIGLRVGSVLCEPHRCRCGQTVDPMGLHPLSCRFSAGRFPRHQALNDIIRRALVSSGVPSTLEPPGLNRGDGKRPDGMTLFPFKRGKCLVWDATVTDTYAASNIFDSATEVGSAALKAEENKRKKYSQLASTYIFEPLAFETTGVCGKSTSSVISELGSRLSDASGDLREAAWLRQRISVAILRGNVTCVRVSAGRFSGDDPD